MTCFENLLRINYSNSRAKSVYSESTFSAKSFEILYLKPRQRGELEIVNEVNITKGETWILCKPPPPLHRLSSVNSGDSLRTAEAYRGEFILRKNLKMKYSMEKPGRRCLKQDGSSKGTQYLSRGLAWRSNKGAGRGPKCDNIDYLIGKHIIPRARLLKPSQRAADKRRKKIDEVRIIYLKF